MYSTSSTDPYFPLPITQNIEVPHPTYVFFLESYKDILREKIPARIDNVMVTVDLYISVHTRNSCEINLDDTICITTYYRLYNSVNESKCTITVDSRVSVYEIKHYTEISSSMREWVRHYVDSYSIIGELMR